jgi:hypothetical protein
MIISIHGQSSSKNKKTDSIVNFVEKYGKTYASKSELLYRDTIFKKNMNMIEQNNKNPKSKFVMGMTRFADMTSD